MSRTLPGSLKTRRSTRLFAQKRMRIKSPKVERRTYSFAFPRLTLSKVRRGVRSQAAPAPKGSPLSYLAVLIRQKDYWIISAGTTQRSYSSALT